MVAALRAAEDRRRRGDHVGGDHAAPGRAADDQRRSTSGDPTQPSRRSSCSSRPAAAPSGGRCLRHRAARQSQRRDAIRPFRASPAARRIGAWRGCRPRLTLHRLGCAAALAVDACSPRLSSASQWPLTVPLGRCGLRRRWRFAAALGAARLGAPCGAAGARRAARRCAAAGRGRGRSRAPGASSAPSRVPRR